MRETAVQLAAGWGSNDWQVRELGPWNKNIRKRHFKPPEVSLKRTSSITAWWTGSAITGILFFFFCLMDPLEGSRLPVAVGSCRNPDGAVSGVIGSQTGRSLVNYILYSCPNRTLISLKRLIRSLSPHSGFNLEKTWIRATLWVSPQHWGKPQNNT